MCGQNKLILSPKMQLILKIITRTLLIGILVIGVIGATAGGVADTSIIEQRLCRIYGYSGAFLFLLWVILYFTIPEEIVAVKISFWLFFFITYLYLSILKPSKYRTIGYMATDVKIVDLHGNKPSWNTMLTRFFLLGFSPFAFIIDILWLTGDHTKQTLRDKYVGTYVVNNMSVPQGSAPLKRVILNFLGWNLFYKEIEKKL